MRELEVHKSIKDVFVENILSRGNKILLVEDETYDFQKNGF